MADERDRLGDKIKDIEAAREDQWARQRDAELIEKLRQKGPSLKCPICTKQLDERKYQEVLVFACPDGHGAWLNGQALTSISK
jgi:Transcription factor zinc-finger